MTNTQGTSKRTGSPTPLEMFVRESNKIEGILRDPTKDEIDVHRKFLALAKPSIVGLQCFVDVCQPDHRLRDLPGLNVRIGRHFPQPGGPEVVASLIHLLDQIYKDSLSPYQAHKEYEILHPFTDCNGRSGRVLWLWHMNHRGLSAHLGFLHTWYYQTLDGGRL